MYAASILLFVHFQMFGQKFVFEKYFPANGTGECFGNDTVLSTTVSLQIGRMSVRTITVLESALVWLLAGVYLQRNYNKSN